MLFFKAKIELKYLILWRIQIRINYWLSAFQRSDSSSDHIDFDQLLHNRSTESHEEQLKNNPGPSSKTILKDNCPSKPKVTQTCPGPSGSKKTPLKKEKNSKKSPEAKDDDGISFNEKLSEAGDQKSVQSQPPGQKPDLQRTPGPRSKTVGKKRPGPKSKTLPLDWIFK